jgi:hypothetical protein
MDSYAVEVKSSLSGFRLSRFVLSFLLPFGKTERTGTNRKT